MLNLHRLDLILLTDPVNLNEVALESALQRHAVLPSHKDSVTLHEPGHLDRYSGQIDQNKYEEDQNHQNQDSRIKSQFVQNTVLHSLTPPPCAEDCSEVCTAGPVHPMNSTRSRFFPSARFSAESKPWFRGWISSVRTDLRKPPRARR